MCIPSEFKGIGYTATGDIKNPKVLNYEPRHFTEDDVMVKIQVCGVCGSDLHFATGAWGQISNAEIVLGHEIVGEAIKVGGNVKDVKVGDIVGVGAKSWSCGDCEDCNNDFEQCCSNAVLTYGDVHKDTGYFTKGGYASHYISHGRFVFPIPKDLPEKYAAPLMCAGLTVFNPLYVNLKENGNKTVGIIGIGGLGHLGIMFAKALGARVIAFSRSSAKKDECINQLGADEFVATGEEPNWADRYHKKIDFYVNCASLFDGLDIKPYIKSLKSGGTWITVGCPDIGTNIPVHAFDLIPTQVSISGSAIGSKTQALKMLEIASKYKIYPMIEEVPINEENCAKVLDRLEHGDVRYRFVLTGIEEFFK